MKPTSIRLRSGTLDTIRGLTLVSMIVYHACWDLVYLYRFDWGWYRSFWAGIWQQKPPRWATASTMNRCFV